MRNFIAAVLAIGILGCASQPDDIATAYVSPIQYQSYTCWQVEAELQRVNRRASDLYGTLKETADNDAGQMGIGLVLFWPALFFLEGGDGPQAQEYARLNGERDALEQSAIQKNCGLSEDQLASTGTETVGAVEPSSTTSGSAAAVVTATAMLTDPASSELAAGPSNPRVSEGIEPGFYGAIAISTKSSFKSGSCLDQPTPERAEACALRECGSFCETRVVFGSGQCAAIAGTEARRRPEDVAVGASSTAAREAALSQCRSHPRVGRYRNRCDIVGPTSCNS